ncbi:MAG: hypothetical protein NDI88_16855 [Lysobacter sp.]|nr:hypothetical protein [Lysobacter sp.]
MNGPSRHDRALATSAAACAALVFVVVASSAWLRLAAPACPPAGCEGFVLADAVRLAHRVAAMGVSVLALLIAALAWRPPVRRGLRATAILVLLLVAALAIVGRRSAGAAPPAVLVANLLGGLTLLALAVGLAAAMRSPRGRVPLAVAASLSVLALAAATGGVLATAPPAEAGPLALAHRALSWGALAGWGLLALSASTPPPARRAARFVVAALAALAALAVANPGWPAAPWLHNLLATVALCLGIAAAFASRSPWEGDGALPGRAMAGP